MVGCLVATSCSILQLQRASLVSPPLFPGVISTGSKRLFPQPLAFVFKVRCEEFESVSFSHVQFK